MTSLHATLFPREMLDVLMSMYSSALSIALTPTPFTVIAFSICVFIIFELYSWSTLLILECLPLPRIEPGGRLRHTRDIYDYAYIYINRLMTSIFLLHVLLFAETYTTAPRYSESVNRTFTRPILISSLRRSIRSCPCSSTFKQHIIFTHPQTSPSSSCPVSGC